MRSIRLGLGLLSVMLGKELSLDIDSSQLGCPRGLGVFLVGGVVHLTGGFGACWRFGLHSRELLHIGLLFGNAHSNELTTGNLEFRFEPILGSIGFTELGVERRIVASQQLDFARLVLILLSVHVQLAMKLNNFLLELLNVLECRCCNRRVRLVIDKRVGRRATKRFCRR